jgi:hypothetical protein
MSRKLIYALTAVALGLSCLVSSAASADQGRGPRFGPSQQPPQRVIVCKPCISHLGTIGTLLPPGSGSGVSGGGGGGGPGHFKTTHR